MVQILQAYKEERGIFLEFLTSGIEISTLVTDYKDKAPQQIIEEGFNSISGFVEKDCIRRGVPFDNELPQFVDELKELVLGGIYDVEYLEGSLPLTFNLNCIGVTALDNHEELTSKCKLTTNVGVLTGASLTINVTAPATVLIKAIYNGLEDVKQCSITFVSLEEQAAREQARKKAEEEMLAAQLAAAKTQKIKELDTACNNDILSGFTCTVKGEVRAFGFDMNDQMNLTGKLTMLNANPSIDTVTWKCKGLEGQLDNYTREEFNQICVAADDAKTAKIGTFWTKKNAVLAATTIEEVNEIV